MARFGGQEHVEMQCGTCGVWHAFPMTRYNAARREGGFWTCPNGHSRGWKKGEEQEEINKIRRERDRLLQQSAQKDDEISQREREISSQKRIVNKLKKRASAGTCPCCQRTFSNMAIHMRNQHPDFLKPNLKVVSK